MALRKERPEALELYRKMLIALAGVAAFLPTLLNLASFLFPILAAVLFAVSARLWKYKTARFCVRLFAVIFTAAAPALCITLATAGYFLTEHFSVLMLGVVALPAVAMAASREEKTDIRMMQVCALCNLVCTGLVIGYIINLEDWMKSVLLGATAFVVFALALVLHPQLFKKKK